MKLLVITQAVDAQDPVLGFFTLWLKELANRFESLEVLCLKKGEYTLSENVRVHSLGKEEGAGRLEYIWRFYTYIWKLRHEYDAVFVHMNQEYVLMGGLVWKLMGKRVYMWRNHYSGSWRTDIAAVFCKKVFCTSKHSYTASFKQAVLMPVGIDLARFNSNGNLRREPRSILFLSRISPSKRPEMFIDSLGAVLARGISFSASIYGSALPQDQAYYDSLRLRAASLGLRDRLRFHPEVPNEKTPAIYNSHDIFVNCSPSGMFDKTLFEAAACGCRVIASSEDFRDSVGEEVYAPDTKELTKQLINNLEMSPDAIDRYRIHMKSVAREESLGTLADRLRLEII